jgi:hypothetical protein
MKYLQLECRWIILQACSDGKTDEYLPNHIRRFRDGNVFDFILQSFVVNRHELIRLRFVILVMF